MTADLFDLARVPALWWTVLGRGQAGGSTIRRARATECPKCQARTLRGLDADLAALVAHADPEPLSALGEAQATILGLRTFELNRHGAGYELDWRDDTHVAGRPAGSGVVDVLAEHRCGSALDHAPPVVGAKRQPTPDHPPF